MPHVGLPAGAARCGVLPALPLSFSTKLCALRQHQTWNWGIRSERHLARPTPGSGASRYHVIGKGAKRSFGFSEAIYTYYTPLFSEVVQVGPPVKTQRRPKNAAGENPVLPGVFLTRRTLKSEVPLSRVIFALYLSPLAMWAKGTMYQVEPLPATGNTTGGLISGRVLRHNVSGTTRGVAGFGNKANRPAALSRSASALLIVATSVGRLRPRISPGRCCFAS